MKQMGVTGQILVFLDLLSQQVPGFHGSESMYAVLKGLPDQNVLASQRYFGLALPQPPRRPFEECDVEDVMVDFYQLSKPMVEPAFLETFFTLFPWHLPLPCNQSIDAILTVGIPLLFPLGKDSLFLRLVSHRNLPDDNPCWSDGAKLAFSRFLDKATKKVGFSQCDLQLFIFSPSATGLYNPHC